MPSVVIHMQKGRSIEEKQKVLDAVHAALMESFKIPEHDRFQRVLEFGPDNFEVPPGKTDRFLHIELTVFAGRSLAAKRSLYQGIVSRLAALGQDPMDLMIVLHEVALDNWGIRGGVPASEVKLGFTVDV